jgi:D-alanyl-D-alanine carboxypeptidase
MVPGRAARYGAATVGPIRPTSLPTALRVVIGLVLVGVGTAAWFGLTPLGESGGPVANAAPSASAPASTAGSPSSAGSPAVSPTAPGPAPSATPTPAPSLLPTPPEPVESSGPPSSTVDLRRKLSLALDGLRHTYGLPGVSAAILFADGSAWRGTSGVANVANERPVKADTEFAVASISKTFLAALILVLAEEDKLDLETPVRQYLPDLAIDKRITVRQLLDHTSGLHDYFYDPDIDEALLADRERVWTAQEALAYVGEPYFEPGEGWHYSNTNYVILGLLAEAVGEAPLPEQLHARFLDPLELKHTYYQGVDDPPAPVARAYRFNGPDLDERPIPLSDGSHMVPFTSVVTAAGSAGSIASTAEDLVRWAKALYDGEVLAPASLAAMVADVEVTAPFKPTVPYGLGVQAATIDGRSSLGHSGRLLGSRSVVRWFPNERIAIAVLTNQSRSDPNLIVRELLNVALGTPLECVGCPPLPVGP